MSCGLSSGSPRAVACVPPPGLEDLSPLPASEVSLLSSPLGLAPWALSPAALEAKEPLKLARTAGGALVVTLPDGLSLAPPSLAAWTKQAAPAGGALGTDAQSTASGGQSPRHDAAEEEAEEEAPKKKKKSRFCKAKRDHYRRLVEQLVEQMKENPDNFSLDAVRLPRSIASCEEAKEKLLATVARFAAGGGDAADAADA